MPLYVPDDTIPKPLYDAIIDSQAEYGNESRQFLALQPARDMAVSVTSLISAPRKKSLFSRHAEEIYYDPVKDLWSSFMGNCIHLVLENQAKKNPNYFVEFRMGFIVTVDGKKVLIHGKLDLYDRVEEAIQDWKLTRPTSILYDKTDHVMQLNVLRQIMKANGYPVKALADVYMFPHLDNTKVGKIEGYPSRNAVTVNVPVLPDEEVMNYIWDRARKHLENLNKDDEDLDFCTDHERWVKESYYKVYFRKKEKKAGVLEDFSTKAAHSFETNAELLAWSESEEAQTQEYQVTEFKGAPKACDYCDVKPFCNQWQNENKAKRQPREARPQEGRGLFG